MFRKMLTKLATSTRRFMDGRCGMDQLNVFLLILALFLNVVSLIHARFGATYIIAGMVVNLISYFIMVWYLFRFFSRNLEKRILENRRFLAMTSRITDRKNRFFRCPNCKQTVRVPRGRGKICIKCPKCGEKFIRKS